ncbi:hypothetical protein DMC30DRAFT_405165 [Rhodotorula diobovata]|uniref:Uncharacterized protein n=1 Tax=Rhodotorula diobovata TaxID=5288 RepID=A0A5C5FLK2_9BASI|nr:hypothetical protein DMC30DRAFT_405165 [Rhodotorula diobovata]
MPPREQVKPASLGVSTAHGGQDSVASPAALEDETALPFADTTNRKVMHRAEGEAARISGDLERSERGTIKPRRPAPAPPALGFAFPARPDDDLVSEAAAPARTEPLRRHVKSTSSISHPPIPDPTYPVRSQPIGLSRSSSLSSSSSFGSAGDLAAQAAGTAPGTASAPKAPEGFLRRLSLSSRSGSDAEKDEVDKPRPRRPVPQQRSESLPCFPPAPSSAQPVPAGVTEDELATLPPNPKLWLPSHLSLYLSSTMSLPPPMRADITAFIRSSRLSGRTFLRLRESDLEEVGINVRWRAALLEAREILRRESLGGRVLWGFEGAGSTAPVPVPVTGAGRAQQQGHRRGGSWQGTSVDVEGSASEDESSKDEWKRSWRASQGVGARDRVRGLRRAFETVEEVSERGTPEKPRGSPAGSPRKGLPRPWRHGRSDSAASDLSDASVDSAGGKYAAVSASSSVRPADDPFLSGSDHSSSSSRGSKARKVAPLSLDLDPLAPRLELDLASAPNSPTSTGSSHGRSLPFATESPAPSRPPSPPPQAQTPRLRPDGTLRAASAKGGSARRVSFREFSGSSVGNTSRAANDDGDSDAEDDDPTLRPVRSPLSSPPMSPRTGSLAELFGLDVPRVAGDTPRRGKMGDELVPMFVPGLPRPPRGEEREGEGGETSRHGKKGSLVLVKKSQFAALQRRMSEVESQLALALGSEGTPSLDGSAAFDEVQDAGDEWEYKGEEIGEDRLREMQERLDGLDYRTTHLATSIPASPTPSARAFASLPSPPPSTSTSSQSLSTAYPDASASTTSRHSRRSKHRQRSESSTLQGSSVYAQEDLPGVWPIEGWRQLSGYVFAASIGIGIVAGEVVAAKLLGLRRR